MGVLYSIPLCSRGTVKDAGNEENTPNANVDDNNNDPTLVINNQPVVLPPSTKIENSSSSITPPNATSTPKRAGSCSSNSQLETGGGIKAEIDSEFLKSVFYELGMWCSVLLQWWVK